MATRKRGAIGWEISDSNEQKNWMKKNKPKLYKKWVKKYGRKIQN